VPLALKRNFSGPMVSWKYPDTDELEVVLMLNWRLLLLAWNGSRPFGHNPVGTGPQLEL
jgi:hypothetical protein